MNITPPPLNEIDSPSRGEDLAYNYRRATALAPQLCRGCASYHINFPLNRLVGNGSGYGIDDADLLASIERSLAAGDGDRPRQVVIVGSGDTRMLSMAAHAASRLGIVPKTRFAVIDRCETPLVLCQDYAARSGIALETIAADVLSLATTYRADLVVVHSLLRFLPDDRREGCLRQWSSWLKPDGRLVVSNTFVTGARGAESDSPSRRLRQLVEAAGVELAEPKETFLARLDRELPWSKTTLTEASLGDLFDRAGLETLQTVTVRSAGGRGRMVAELRPRRT
jgi:SAM-dependent methyltransferase